MTCLKPTTLAALGLCLLGAPAAHAAGASSLALSPLCVARSGAALFFLERTDDCGGASRHCRGSRWAWAALKGGAWDLEALGEAALDDESSPETNAAAGRQLFKASAANPCVSYLRAPRMRSPDLPDSEAWFQYSIDHGALWLHWQGQRASIEGEVKIWRAGWPDKEGPRLEAKALGSGVFLGDVGDKGILPATEVDLGGEVVFGFPEPRPAAGEQGFLAIQVAAAKLHAAQAKLLHEDAKRLLEKSGDLFVAARAAGLLDAGLQLLPEDGEARFDYARLLAKQGDAAKAVRELEHLKAVSGLRGRIGADKAFDAVRAKDPFKKFVEGLPR